MPPYFLTLRLPYMLLGTDAADDLDRVLEPQLTHEKKARVFYKVDSQNVATGLLELFGYGKPSPGIPGDPTKPVGSLEGARNLVEGICQPVFELQDCAELDRLQRVLYRDDLELLEKMADCDGDPGIREDLGLPNDRWAVLAWQHYEQARRWERLLLDDMGIDEGTQEGPVEATRKTVYLWFMLCSIVLFDMSDDMNGQYYFHTTDSEDVADHLCALFQKREGEKLWFGCTLADDLNINQKILANDSIKKFQDSKEGSIDSEFYAQAVRWEEQLRKELGLGPKVSPAIRKPPTKVDHCRAKTAQEGDRPAKGVAPAAQAKATVGDITIHNHNNVHIDPGAIADLVSKMVMEQSTAPAVVRAGQTPSPGETAEEESAQGARLSDRVKAAYGQYLQAAKECTGKDGREPTDQQCYDWLSTHNDGDTLPAFETWQRYLRDARRCLGKQKNAPRAGRSHGQSIVSSQDIELTETDKAD